MSCGAVMPVYAASTTYYSYPNAPQVDSVNPYVSLKVGTSVSNNLDDFFLYIQLMNRIKLDFTVIILVFIINIMKIKLVFFN